MKKLILGLTVLSAFGAAAVQAAPTVGASGVIKFTGSINADSCVVHSNGPGSPGGSTLEYKMGTVPVSTLGTEADPQSSQGALTPVPTVMNLEIECASGTSVELSLAPTTVSGKGIGVTGEAENVQIMLVREDKVLDFSNSPVRLDAPLVGNSASIPLMAYYTLQAGKDSTDVVVGSADATVAYILSYN